MVPIVERDGRTFVSVTTAMKVVKRLTDEPDEYAVPGGGSTWAAAEGIACHQTCFDYITARYKLPVAVTGSIWCPSGYPSLDRWLALSQRARKAFAEFCEQYEVMPGSVEPEVVSTTYGLIGHPDLVCTLRRRKILVSSVIDLKFTASILPSHRLQVRCYHRLLGKAVNAGFIWWCNRETGDWRLEEVDLTNDLHDVVAVSYAAKLVQWHSEKGGVYT